MSEIRSKYFSHNELKCSHCGENKMDPQFLVWLDEVRQVWGKPIKLTSAYRCPTHNQVVSSTGADGPHTTGKAVDILIDRREAFNFIELALRFGVRGLGLNQKGSNRFVHVDLIEDNIRPTVWTY